MEKLNLPPDQAGYTVTDGNEVISVQLDGGLPRTRRDILGAASRVTATWTLGPNEYQYIRAFFRVIAVKAAQPFLMDLLLDLPTLTEHVCKMVPGSMRLVEQNGQKFVVSCEVDAIPSIIEDDDFALSLVTVIAIYGEDWPNFRNELEHLLNVQLPESLPG